MAQPPMLETSEILRHVKAHVESLRSAGVEWLPAGPPLSGLPTVSRAPSAPTPVAAPVVADVSPLTLAPLPAPPGDIEERRRALTVLAQEVAACTRCPALASTRTQTVFGQGELGVELCFVGEAPGADEDAQGLPFVGAAGQYLTRIIEGCGIKRAEVYICNVLKCRPPGNRTPLPDECANCRGFLDRQIELVKPRYIVALGGCAATNLLNTTQSLGRLRGRFHDYKGIPLLVTYHPSYLLPHRHPEKKRDVWEDMQLLLTRMGRPIPGKG